MRKALGITLGAAAVFFAVTFTIYFFNLDSKLEAMAYPFLEKHYDEMPRKSYL